MQQSGPTADPRAPDSSWRKFLWPESCTRNFSWNFVQLHIKNSDRKVSHIFIYILCAVADLKTASGICEFALAEIERTRYELDRILFKKILPESFRGRYQHSDKDVKSANCAMIKPIVRLMLELTSVDEKKNREMLYDKVWVYITIWKIESSYDKNKWDKGCERYCTHCLGNYYELDLYEHFVSIKKSEENCPILGW